MKTSDSDLKVNRNIYPDVVNVCFTTLELRYHLLKTIAFLPLKKVVLFMNVRAVVKLGT